MKQLFLIVLCTLSFGAFAYEGTLMDFSNLAPGSSAVAKTQLNLAPMLSRFSTLTAGVNVPKTTDLGLDRWVVQFANQLVATPEAKNHSKVSSATVNAGSSQFAGQKVLGADIYFPKEDIASYADIKPPFPIPGISGLLNNGKYGYGVIDNVGQVTQVAVDVYGLNNNNNISLLLQDGTGMIHEYPLGKMNYVGWRKLVWTDPNAIVDPEYDKIAVPSPVYPVTHFFLRFAGIRVYKTRYQSGHVVSYFKDVKIVYHKEQLVDPNKDVNNDAVWKIYQQYVQKDLNNSMFNLAQHMVLLALGKKRNGGGDLTTPLLPISDFTNLNATGASASNTGTVNNGQTAGAVTTNNNTNNNTNNAQGAVSKG